MFKNLYKKLFGTNEVIRIENVDVLGETLTDKNYEPQYWLSHIYFPGTIITPRPSNNKFILVDVKAKRKDGSLLDRTYSIPSYCAHGITRKMKNYEGREVKVRMRNKLPKKLPHML